MKMMASHVINNNKFGHYVAHINPIELEIKDTTDKVKFPLYLDLQFQIDSGDLLRTKDGDKVIILDFQL